MWPFPKRPKRPETLAFQSICPLCFEQYPPGEIITAYPVCSDCSSEALDIEVENVTAFMASKTVEDFDAILARWEGVEGFLPAYKKAKADRIRALRDRKAREGE